MSTEFEGQGGRRRTKIVATVGPATSTSEALGKLLRAGVDVCRINCSHSDADSIRQGVSRIRRVAIGMNRKIAILLDLQGPKIRTGPAQSPVELEPGDILTVIMDPNFMADGKRIGTTWPTLVQDVKAGERVLFADGALSGHVAAVRSDEVDILIDHGGSLGAHKGINLPESGIDAPSLTAKDLADLAVGVAAGVDYVALSFVRNAADIAVLREALTALGQPDLPIIAKIEKPEAVDNIEEIVTTVQGIMVARGDLGVELELEKVPVIQKELIKVANAAGVPVITATQMLDSMERNPRPTRAETTDVANAILDGTDAIMLSGETSVGEYPFEAVAVMDRIARHVENSRFLAPRNLDNVPALAGPERTVARVACVAVQEGDRPLVVFTWSGRSAIRASKARLRAPVFALTPNQTVCDRLSLVWGVTAVHIPVFESIDEMINAGEQILLERGFVKPGTEVVVLAGITPMRGATNLMKLEVIGAD